LTPFLCSRSVECGLCPAGAMAPRHILPDGPVGCRLLLRAINAPASSEEDTSRGPSPTPIPPSRATYIVNHISTSTELPSCTEPHQDSNSYLGLSTKRRLARDRGVIGIGEGQFDVSMSPCFQAIQAEDSDDARVPTAPSSCRRRMKPIASFRNHAYIGESRIQNR
jgi:hypothetical protein